MTVFALAEEDRSIERGDALVIRGSDKNLGTSGYGMNVDGDFKALLGASFENPDQVEVLATGSVSLRDLVDRSEGWLCGPAPMKFPISIRAARPTDAGIQAPPPDGMHVTDISSFVFESLIHKRRQGSRGARSSGHNIEDEAHHGDVHHHWIFQNRHRRTKWLRTDLSMYT